MAPRRNLELIAAIARSADEASLRRWAGLGADVAPGNAPPVALAVAEIVGLRRFVRETR